MARRKQGKPSRDWLFPTAAIQLESEPDASLLDVVDSVLNKGAVVNGELILGVANVDLIYAKLSVLLGALDRITKSASAGKHEGRRRKRKHEGPRRSRSSTKKT
jgi:hypothetical protein